MYNAGIRHTAPTVVVSSLIRRFPGKRWEAWDEAKCWAHYSNVQTVSWSSITGHSQDNVYCVPWTPHNSLQGIVIMRNDTSAGFDTHPTGFHFKMLSKAWEITVLSRYTAQHLSRLWVSYKLKGSCLKAICKSQKIQLKNITASGSCEPAQSALFVYTQATYIGVVCT